MQYMRNEKDPSVLMDAKCRPLSSYDAMEKRIKLLERQLDRALRLLRGQKMRADMAISEHDPTAKMITH